MEKPSEVYPYLSNLPFFPDDYFKNHTAEELELSENGRKELIKMQEEFQEQKKKFTK